MQNKSSNVSKPSERMDLKPLIRRTVIFIVSLSIMVALAASTFALYNNHQKDLKFDDLESKNKTVDANGVFEGYFRSKLEAWTLTDFDYYVKDDDLYITLLGTAGDREPLPTDKEGYAFIKIESGFTNIDKVYYIYGEKKVSLSIKKV